MEVKDIIVKNNITQKEMEFVVEQYIKDLKGLDVNIDIFKRCVFQLQIKRQLDMLYKAYEYAVNYFYGKYYR